VFKQDQLQLYEKKADYLKWNTALTANLSAEWIPQVALHDLLQMLL
jgi:hypothetical protein